jgi:signal transduction histidine kinase
MRFAATGGAVMLIGMILIGSWVGGKIEDGVTRNSAITTALYMESFIAPLTQELSAQDTVSPATAARLDKLFREPHLAARIASVKIWKQGGLIAFSNDPGLIGARFAPSGSLRAAWNGSLSAEFNRIGDAEAVFERGRDLPMLEVYNPIHSTQTGEVIAVAEFYQIAEELEDDLFSARLMSWVVVASICTAMFGLLFGIVRRGARTIDHQHEELELRFAEVARVSEQNAALRRRIQRASLRASELNERHLRRISAELHDGPAQALALAALRLDTLPRRMANGDGEEELGVIRSSLADAMREMREISRGLSLPQIEGKSLAEVLALVIGAHERRTGTRVAADLGPCADSGRSLDHSAAICVYRFVQEGLSNAFRHGGGVGQSVSCAVDGDALTITLEDAGPGFDSAAPSNGLGLAGLRERVESIGGEFRLEGRPGHGARLSMTLTPGG